MKHVDRCWKAYLVGNKGESPELRVDQQSANHCLKEKCATVNMDKSGNCIPRGSKTMKSS